MATNVVSSDLKNVYVWDTARKMLPYLSNKLMMEGKRGRKFEPVSLGDAASMAIMEACERRGLSLLPAGPEIVKAERRRQAKEEGRKQRAE